MSFTQVFLEEKEYLLCISDGDIPNVETYIQWAMEVIGKAKERRHNRILMDNRTLRLRLTQLDVVTFADYLEKMEAHKMGFRLAVLSNRANLDVSRMVETALVNRSGSYKSFQEKTEALAWLLT